jgi:hypothetical protein
MIQTRYRPAHVVTLNTQPTPDLPRVSRLGRHAIRQAFSGKRPQRLQESEIIFAGVMKIGVEGRTPAIVLADTVVEEHVVPPSESTRAF